jgi:hypothetical protein
MVISTSGMKGQQERKRLDWSINYDKKVNDDGKGGQSSRLDRKRRVGKC